MGLYRKWFLRGLRLALVAGLMGAGWHSWDVLDRYSADAATQSSMKLAYECAARQSDEQLASRQNPVGNINVRDLCLTGRDFYVSWPEMQAMRAGTMKFETTLRPFDWQGSAIIGIAWTLIMALMSLGVLFAITVARWVWGTTARERGRQ